MFKFQSSMIQLKNAIIQEVSDRVYCLFPRDQGWNLILPQAKNKKTLNILRHCLLIQKEKDTLCFMPIGQQIEADYYQPLFREKCKDSGSLQFIFLTDEFSEEKVLAHTEGSNKQVPVLSLNSKGFSFSRGEFEDLRLNFRLQKLKLNPDMLSNHLFYFPFEYSDIKEKAALIKKVFTYISSNYCRKRTFFTLKQLILGVFPCYPYLNKSGQEQIFSSIASFIVETLQTHLDDFIKLKQINNKNHEDFEIRFLSPQNEMDLKWLKSFISQQEKALKEINCETQQMTIDDEVKKLLETKTLDL